MFRKRFIGALVGAIALVGLVLTPVSASYPGAANGRIAVAVRAANGSFNIYSMQPNGAGLMALTSGTGRHLCPDYSADGKQIAYCSDVSGAWEIWTMKQNGTRQTQLTDFGAFAIFPDFSPNGSTIAFSGFVGAPQNDQIYVVDAATGLAPQQLTNCPTSTPNCFSDYPVWSPDGTKIAFTRGDGFDADDNPVNEQVWIMNSDGTNAHALTSGADPKDQVPDWSPDGSRIAYSSGQFGSEGIWTMNADGSNQRQLTGCGPTDPAPCEAGDDWGTAWSPDGSKIAFLRDLTSLGIPDRPVYVMNADGSDATRITTTPGLRGVPAWQARGTDSDQ
ncbi:MAG: PD40 domain-containing protein [Chloroflexi bacterium]|nr:PD40 domain-containing protein [Chloroflexota bacterium]